jgi:type IV pilus biogenesis protein CpaD/CtpE
MTPRLSKSLQRLALSALLGAALLTGCASSPKSETAAQPKNPPRKATATVVEAPPKNKILPFNGRVAGVNDKLRFVIIDFTNTRRPELDQRLGVYRVGQKVAEIKVSGPYRNMTVAADLLAGEVKYGDEVKAE